MEDKGGVWSIFNIGQKNPARHAAGSKRKNPNENADGKGPATSEPADKKQKVGPAKAATVDAAAPKQKKQHKRFNKKWLSEFSWLTFAPDTAPEPAQVRCLLCCSCIFGRNDAGFTSGRGRRRLVKSGRKRSGTHVTHVLVLSLTVLGGRVESRCCLNGVGFPGAG